MPNHVKMSINHDMGELFRLTVLFIWSFSFCFFQLL